MSGGSGGGGAGRESGKLDSSEDSGEDGLSRAAESTSLKPGCWEGDGLLWAGPGCRQGEGGVGGTDLELEH